MIEAAIGEQALLSLVIREGRNRQVRKMCDAIGHPVVRLRRVRIGPIVDERIRPGEFRELTARARFAQLQKQATTIAEARSAQKSDRAARPRVDRRRAGRPPRA